MRLSAILIVTFTTLAAAQVKSNSHCPSNCVPVLATICDSVEGILENVPIIQKEVPFVLEIVGRAICFPEEPKPHKDSLCPSKCGKSDKAKEVFTKVCNYVDDILQATPAVPKQVRNLTDFAICALGDLIPGEAFEDTSLLQLSKGDSHDTHCPSNCVEEMVDICDKVEGILENVPVVSKVPFILEIVGKAICFPEKPKPNPDTLCPKKCGNPNDEDNEEIFTRVCNYVDNILQSAPGVSDKVRNITDIAICTIGALIPDDVKELDNEKTTESFCPENCEPKLEEVCDFVEGVLTAMPNLNEVTKKELGRAICFPESAKSHPNSSCPKDCGNEKSQKICEYVDLLMQVPEIPAYARNLTATVICKLGKLHQKDLVEMQASIYSEIKK